MISAGAVTTLLLAARRDEDDALMLGVAIGVLVLSIGAVVGGVMLVRKKQVAPAVVLFILAGLGLLSALGIGALIVLARLAWH